MSAEKKSLYSDYEEVPEKPYVVQNSKYLSWMYKLDNLGVEIRGIERVTSDERATNSKWKSFMQVIGLWFAACGGVTTMSSFFLPTLAYYLDMKSSLIAALIGVNVGNLVPAYTSTMGPQSGCRQMVTARFLFGQWFVKIIAIIVIIGGIGWSVINCVAGGQLISAISNAGLEVGIVVIMIVSWIIGVFGIRVLLKFQTTLAIPTNVAILLFYIVVCKKTSHIADTNQAIRDMNMDSQTNAGHWLSVFALAYSVTSTWGSGAADYYILFPEGTPDWQVFMLTFLGIAIPSNFAAVCSIIAGAITFTYHPWLTNYDAYGIGGIFASAFEPWHGFGKFVVVILYISLMCNNIMNTYSCALEFQLIDTRLAYVPRWVWVTVVAVIYLVLALAGKEHLNNILSNFLPMLGYWITMYITLLLEENLIFRSTQAARRLHYNEFDVADGEKITMLYNWANWNRPNRRSIGLAATFAFLCGVAGAVLGMNQVYYVGVLAEKIGHDGADIGMWLCIGFTGLTYPPLRYFELKKFGR
ncbi:hypothetical protein FDK38_004369 [Candidozyma auris]|nr:hypothetical protein FDK38_004369 [[Candida] auris]